MLITNNNKLERIINQIFSYKQNKIYAFINNAKKYFYLKKKNHNVNLFKIFYVQKNKFIILIKHYFLNHC